MFFWILLLFITPLAAKEVENHAGGYRSVGHQVGTQEAPSEIMQNFDAEPSCFVDKVNVITGTYQEFSQDLVIPGPEPLVLQRAFSSQSKINGSLYNGWNLNYGGVFYLNTTKPCLGTLTGAFGSGLIFSGEKVEKHGLTPLSLATKRMWGLANTASGRMSGRTNLKNQTMFINRKDDYSCLKTGDGTTSFYDRSDGVLPDYVWSGFGRLIRSETKPNGNKVLYTYDSENRLSTVSTSSANGVIFGQVTFAYPTRKQFDHKPNFYVYTNDGRFIRCYFKFIKDAGYFLTSIDKPEGPVETYDYQTLDDQTLIIEKKQPNGRYLKTRYYGKGQHSTAEGIIKSDKKDFFYRCVSSQSAPLGQDATPILKHHFTYHFDGEIHTHAYDAYNHKTRYTKTTNRLLSKITKYDAGNQIYRIEKFAWGKEKAVQDNLISRSMQNPDGSILGGKAYQYDVQGNVLKKPSSVT